MRNTLNEVLQRYIIKHCSENSELKNTRFPVTMNEDWRTEFRNKKQDQIRKHEGVIIGVQETGEEVGMLDVSFTGDEDGWEYVVNKKIDRLRNQYPEYRGFYLEDRTNWNRQVRRQMWDDEGVDPFENDLEIFMDEHDKDEPLTEDEIAEFFMGDDIDYEEDIENIIETLKEYGYTVTK